MKQSRLTKGGLNPTDDETKQGMKRCTGLGEFGATVL